jgi:phospho-2-dehydro-3-deoxyheptonate aldolase
VSPVSYGVGSVGSESSSRADGWVRFESNLKGGKQSSDKGRANLEYGVSITDACVDWEMTVDMLDNLNQVGDRHLGWMQRCKEIPG